LNIASTSSAAGGRVFPAGAMQPKSIVVPAQWSSTAWILPR
jgi:hypothetical protein